MAKSTRMYEVPVPAKDGVTDPKVYLVEAASPSGAENRVARMYVGAAKIADGKRVAELIGEKKAEILADEPAA